MDRAAMQRDAEDKPRHRAKKEKRPHGQTKDLLMEKRPGSGRNKHRKNGGVASPSPSQGSAKGRSKKTKSENKDKAALKRMVNQEAGDDDDTKLSSNPETPPQSTNGFVLLVSSHSVFHLYAPPNLLPSNFHLLTQSMLLCGSACVCLSVYLCVVDGWVFCMSACFCLSLCLSVCSFRRPQSLHGIPFLTRVREVAKSLGRVSDFGDVN